MISLNQQALDELHSPEKKLVILPGATHLFEEPGALEQVAAIAADWFAGHFPPVGDSQRRQVSQAR